MFRKMSKAALTLQTLDNAFNFFQRGARSWVRRTSMICRINNRALFDAGAVPDTNADASLVPTSDDLNVHSILGRGPTRLQLPCKRIGIYFGAQIGSTSAPRARVSAVGAVHDTEYVTTAQS